VPGNLRGRAYRATWLRATALMKEVGQQLRPSIKRRWHPLDWVALAFAGLALVNARCRTQSA
jgi:hypothetical protein